MISYNTQVLPNTVQVNHSHSVKKLKELLDTLPDDYMIYTKTLGHTGNLPIVKDGISIGVVDIGHEYQNMFDYGWTI